MFEIILFLSWNVNSKSHTRSFFLYSFLIKKIEFQKLIKMVLKCNICEHEPWSKGWHKCRDQHYNCFICDILIKERNRTNYMSEHYNNPDLYITCCSCKIHKQISYFRFKTQKCRLCTYLQRYRFCHTKDKFRGHAIKYYIELTHVVGKNALCVRARAFVDTSSIVMLETTGYAWDHRHQLLPKLTFYLELKSKL